MSNVLTWYSDRFAVGIMDAYVETCQYNSPPTAEGYANTNACYSANILFAVPDNMTGAGARSAITQFLVDNPNTGSDAWCKNSPAYAVPMPYVGTYMASDRNGRTISGANRHSCPHCAMQESRTLQAGRHRPTVAAILVHPTIDIPAQHRPILAPIEVIGETPLSDTSTVKDYSGSPGYSCGNCGRLGHNSRGCTYVAKHFDRIGVEVEGRFLDLSAKKRIVEDMGGNYSGDGSIHESPDSDAQAYELKTKPGSLRETIEQVIAYYPDETDSSCGMHVHISFPQDCLTLLHTEAFFKYFADRWEKWGTAMNLPRTGEFFKRLTGENDYCLKNEDVRRDMSTGERYEQLNFSAWRGHKTLECRLLPMFRRSSLAVAAIQELVSIYEDFLAAPELYGVAYADFMDAGVDEALLAGSAPHVLDPIQLEMPALRAYSGSTELELSEMPKCAENMVRIALPVNQPITVEALSARLTALRAA